MEIDHNLSSLPPASASAESELAGLTELFGALGDPARLRILSLIAHAGEVCGADIEAVTGYGASKISRHLAQLKRARVVQDRREGVWVFHSSRPSTGAARAKLDRLLEDLAQYYAVFADDKERLAALPVPGVSARKVKTRSNLNTGGIEPGAASAAGGAMFGKRPKKNVLFLCQTNAARSQIAEAFLKKYGGDQFEVFSAGLQAGEIHAFTRQVMAEVGLNLEGQRAKGVNEFLGRKAFAYVIALCLEAEEECPRMFPGAGEVKNWPFEDIANSQLPEAEKLARFRIVRDRIEQRVKEWLKD
jgi:arsenate reductase